jgi:tetratricopeptide (TPR) repeat protein
VKRNKRAADKVFERAKHRVQPGESASSPLLTRRIVNHALLLAAIIGATFFAYSNSLHAPFLLDNDPLILNDARLRTATASHIHRILSEQYPLALSGLYRPLTTLSYLFNYAILGEAANPAGYHWFNLILHAVNIALVYMLGLAIFEDIPVAALLTAIWGLHPVQTEAVTNIVGRADMLAAFGVLAALLCHRQAIRTSGRRKAAWLTTMALAVAIGMFSKESAIVVVGVIALYDFTFAKPASWRSRLPSYIAIAAPCLVFLYVRAQVLAAAAAAPFPFGDNPLIGASFWTARLTAVKIIGQYLLLLLWPARLSWDYSYNQIPSFAWKLSDWEDWKTVIALVAVVAVVAAAIRSYQRYRPVFFFIFFFFIALAPVSNLVIIIGSIMGERFLYLPSVGFAACAAVVFFAVWQRLPTRQPAYRQAGVAALAVILIALVVRTYDRNADWVNPGQFWQSGLEAAPGSYKTNLVAATKTFLLPQNDWSRTIAEVDRALAILDRLPDLENVGFAYRDAALVYRVRGDGLSLGSTSGSTSGNTSGSASNETNPEYWYRKSLNAALRSEKIELAQDRRVRLLNQSRGKPGLTFVPSALYLQMGITYARLSDPQHALAAFERGRGLDTNPDLLEQLADAYRAAGDLRKAAATLVEAIAEDPSRYALTSKLFELYTEIDPHGCAVSRDGGQPSLNLNCPMVHGDICTASRNMIDNLARGWRNFDAAAIRRTAVASYGCAPELLN